MIGYVWFDKKKDPSANLVEYFLLNDLKPIFIDEWDDLTERTADCVPGLPPISEHRRMPNEDEMFAYCLVNEFSQRPTLFFNKGNYQTIDHQHMEIDYCKLSLQAKLDFPELRNLAKYYVNSLNHFIPMDVFKEKCKDCIPLIVGIKNDEAVSVHAYKYKTKIVFTYDIMITSYRPGSHIEKTYGRTVGDLLAFKILNQLSSLLKSNNNAVSALRETKD